MRLRLLLRPFYQAGTKNRVYGKLSISRYSRLQHLPSPPAWGAWIETVNPWVYVLRFLCRPPRGGRGLKHSAPGVPEVR